MCKREAIIWHLLQTEMSRLVMIDCQISSSFHVYRVNEKCENSKTWLQYWLQLTLKPLKSEICPVNRTSLYSFNECVFKRNVYDKYWYALGLHSFWYDSILTRTLYSITTLYNIQYVSFHFISILTFHICFSHHVFRTIFVVKIKLSFSNQLSLCLLRSFLQITRYIHFV